jgi:fucose permease
MKRNYYLVGLILLTFFVISFLTNIIGPLVPSIIKGFDLSLTLVAVLPFAFFIAYGVVSIPAGALAEKYNQKMMMASGFVVALFGALLLAIFPNYLTAVISLFLIGAGMAMLQVVINPLLRAAGGAENYSFNSVLAQLIFGLASFVSPLVYSYLVLNLKNSSPSHNVLLSTLNSLVPPDLLWVSLYWIFAVICVIMIFIIFFSRFPTIELSDEEKVEEANVYRQLIKRPTVILFFFGILAYVGTEQGVANWISEFLFRYHGYDPQTTGAHAVSWFWGLMAAGGIVGLGLVKLFDSRKVLIGFSCLAIICLSVALFGGATAALYAFPTIGFFASVMYPLVISLALNSLKEHHGAFAGILMTGIIGGAIVPLIIGGLGDTFGLRHGLFFLYVTMGYILSVGFWARPIINNKTIQLSKKEAANEKSQTHIA